MLFRSPESPVLSPGWRYSLNVVTDIKATDDFLTLDEKDKACSIESKEDCSTRSFVKRVSQACGCLPLSLRSKVYATVNISVLIFSMKQILFLVEHLFPGEVSLCQERVCH